MPRVIKVQAVVPGIWSNAGVKAMLMFEYGETAADNQWTTDSAQTSEARGENWSEMDQSYESALGPGINDRRSK